MRVDALRCCSPTNPHDLLAHTGPLRLQGKSQSQSLPLKAMTNLNIKNDQTCALIRELSHLTSGSMTHAVAAPVRERLDVP